MNLLVHWDKGLPTELSLILFTFPFNLLCWAHRRRSIPAWQLPFRKRNSTDYDSILWRPVIFNRPWKDSLSTASWTSCPCGVNNDSVRSHVLMEWNGWLKEWVWLLGVTEILLFAFKPRPAKGHTAYCPMLLGVVIVCVKRSEREVEHLHLCSVELRMFGAYPQCDA